MKQKKSFKQYCLDCTNIIVLSMKVFFQLIYGGWKISSLLSPRISFFGGSKWLETDPWSKEARKLAYKLAEANVSILTGGGPGIMEAANCGAAEVGNRINKLVSMGVGVKDLPNEEGINTCAQGRLILDNFFIRKWLLINYSVGFVIFPGGTGTMDEISTLLTLMETKKMHSVPIILIGKDYWKVLMEWIINFAIKNKTISENQLKLITFTDDIDEAFNILIKHCCNNNQQGSLIKR